MSKANRRRFWVPIESLLAHVPDGVEACDLQSHWRFVRTTPRVRKAAITIEFVERCERIAARQNVALARALLGMPKPDPADWHLPLPSVQIPVGLRA